MLKAFESFDFSGYDLVISSSHAFAKGIKTPKNTLHICYCHYPLRYVWEPKVDPRLAKNPIYNLMRVFLKRSDRLAAKRPDLYLANSENTAQKIQKHYGRKAFVIYPPVEIEKLKKLYANCKALIFPGEEDFGIIPVEVMASGRPVVALRRGGVCETVLEGKCGAFFNQPTPESLRTALKKITMDQYKIEDLIARAEEFSKDKFKEKIQEFIKKHYNETKAF